MKWLSNLQKKNVKNNKMNVSANKKLSPKWKSQRACPKKEEKKTRLIKQNWKKRWKGKLRNLRNKCSTQSRKTTSAIWISSPLWTSYSWLKRWPKSWKSHNFMRLSFRSVASQSLQCGSNRFLMTLILIRKLFLKFCTPWIHSVSNRKILTISASWVASSWSTRLVSQATHKPLRWQKLYTISGRVWFITFPLSMTKMVVSTKTSIALSNAKSTRLSRTQPLERMAMMLFQVGSVSGYRLKTHLTSLKSLMTTLVSTIAIFKVMAVLECNKILTASKSLKVWCWV